MYKYFFIAGAPKSGTTKLAYDLSSHPEICVSNPKETNFFSRNSLKRLSSYYKEWVCQSESQYEKCFKKDTPYIWRCDGSVSYFDSTDAAIKIKEKHPNSKFIFILRDPVERTLSHYSMDLRLGYVSKGLNEVLENRSSFHFNQYIEISLYKKHIQRYVSIFGEENIYISSFNYFRDDYKSFIEDICLFLEIENIKIEPSIQGLNEALMPKNIIISQLYKLPILRKLLRLFAPKKIKFFLRSILFNNTLKKDYHDINKEFIVLLKQDHKDLIKYMNDRNLNCSPDFKQNF